MCVMRAKILEIFWGNLPRYYPNFWPGSKSLPLICSPILETENGGRFDDRFRYLSISRPIGSLYMAHKCKQLV